MKKKDLIGKTILGFSFKGDEYVSSMDEHIGCYGTIKKIDGKFALVLFEDSKKAWWYTLKGVRKNLVFGAGKIISDKDAKVEFTIQEIADIIDIPVGLLRIKL